MQTTNTMARGSASVGQIFAAIGIILFLAITVPVLGVVMIPGVLTAAWWRAHRSDVRAMRWGVAARSE